MNKGISFRPFYGLMFFPRQKFGMAPFMEGAHGVLLCKNGIDPPAIYVFDHFMRESKYENHMFKVQSTLRTSAALEFGDW